MHRKEDLFFCILKFHLSTKLCQFALKFEKLERFIKIHFCKFIPFIWCTGNVLSINDPSSRSIGEVPLKTESNHKRSIKTAEDAPFFGGQDSKTAKWVEYIMVHHPS